MTPQKKAEQLYRDFYSKTMISRVGGIAKKHIAIASALLCVDELIKEVKYFTPDIRKRYYEEVKQELEKLL